MHFRQDPPADGDQNMAADADLLESAEGGDPGARLYEWTGPWISLGRFQDPARDLLDPATPWVLRPTGGKAVLHGNDWTVGIAVSFELLRVESRSLRASYRAIIAPIVAALRACGVAARLAEETRFSGKGPKTADCFAFNSPNDVVDEGSGRKVCGCALRLGRNAVLAQASIPKGPPLISASKVVRGAVELEVAPWRWQAFPDALADALESWHPQATG